MQTLINYLAGPSRNVVGLITDYMSFEDKPHRMHINKEDLLFNAWLITGMHLKKSMGAYGREIEEKYGAVRTKA